MVRGESPDGAATLELLDYGLTGANAQLQPWAAVAGDPAASPQQGGQRSP
jgi:hypothetical protein